VPTLLVRLAFRFSGVWILLASAAMLIVQYSGMLPVIPGVVLSGLAAVAGYAVFQYLLALAFLWSAPRTGRWSFSLVVLLSLLPLAGAKFLPRFTPDAWMGFLGISYLTFRSLDVLFSIRDRAIVALPPSQFFAYLLFFPTISSGPIDRWRRFADDWKRHHKRSEFWTDLDGAVHRVFTGFFYKFIVAALIKRYWLDPAAEGSGVGSILSYMYAYTFYLFFDFAGYSAFAVGFSYLFGIHTPENFNRPFLARNIRDFWNRWHITLSWWLRDHVYMRFVMAATKGRWFKSKHTASYIGLFLAFGLMGLWHGVEWYYLVYGLYHACLQVVYDLFDRWNKQRKIWGDGILWRSAGVLLTFHAVSFSFLLF
jgi:membrane protein involved in D-alanine export